MRFFALLCVVVAVGLGAAWIADENHTETRVAQVRFSNKNAEGVPYLCPLCVYQRELATARRGFEQRRRWYIFGMSIPAVLAVGLLVVARRRTTTVVAALLSALAFAASASAVDAPAGFRASVRLSPIASYAAGKPVTAWCSLGESKWTATSGSGLDIGGYAIVGGQDIFLRQSVCRSLEGWMRGKPVLVENVAGGLLTLLHESAHARGVADEQQATCAALAGVLPSAMRFLHAKPRRAALIRTAAAGAVRFMPPAYAAAASPGGCRRSDG